MITLEKHLGGSFWNPIGTNHKLGSQSPRVQYVSVANPGSKIWLPPATYMRPGGPRFIIANNPSSTYPLELVNRTGVTEIAEVPPEYSVTSSLVDPSILDGSTPVGLWTHRLRKLGGAGWGDPDLDEHDDFLLAAWQFNQSGSMGDDTAPANNDLSLVVSPTSITGRYGAGTNLSGGYFTRDGNLSTPVEVHHWTWSLWFRYDTSPASHGDRYYLVYWIGNPAPGTGSDFTIYLANHYSYIWLVADSATIGPALGFSFNVHSLNLFDGQWHNLIFKHKMEYNLLGIPTSAEQWLYLDGNLLGNTSGLGHDTEMWEAGVNRDEDLILGRKYDGTSAWPGDMDEFYFWAGAKNDDDAGEALLSDDAVAALWNSGAGTFYVG